MPRTIVYVVTRIGSNAANQSLCPSADIGFVEATTRQKAKEEAVSKFNCYANQHLEITPESRVSVSRWNALLDEIAMCSPKDPLDFFV